MRDFPAVRLYDEFPMLARPHDCVNKTAFRKVYVYGRHTDRPHSAATCALRVIRISTSTAYTQNKGRNVDYKRRRVFGCRV